MASKEKLDDKPSSSTDNDGIQTATKTRRPSFNSGERSTSISKSSTIGYKMYQGKYEDDEFEPVGIKVLPEAFQLSVYISKMDEPERDPVFVLMNWVNHVWPLILQILLNYISAQLML